MSVFQTGATDWDEGLKKFGILGDLLEEA